MGGYSVEKIGANIKMIGLCLKQSAGCFRWWPVNESLRVLPGKEIIVLTK